MIKKIIIIFIFIIVGVFVKDYFGSVDTSSHGSKPKIFETRDEFFFKSKNNIDLALK